MAFAALVFACVGCERSEPNSSNNPSRTTPSTSSPSTSPSTRVDSHKQEITAWRKQLDDDKTRIDALRVKASNAAPAVRDDLTNGVHDLESLSDQIQSRLNDYKDTGQSNWDTYRTDIEGMFNRLNEKLRDVSDKFSSASPSPSITPGTEPNNPNMPSNPTPTSPDNPVPPKPTNPG
jgi:hypothetical protein